MTAAPGTYEVLSGRAEVKPDGRIILQRLELKPSTQAPKVKPEPQSIEQIWSDLNNFGLTFPKFIEVLEAKGYKTGEMLNLTGKQVKSLYECLKSMHCLPDIPSMVDLYPCLALSFKLKFKSHNSLHRLKVLPDDITFWMDLFAFCVHDDKRNKQECFSDGSH